MSERKDTITAHAARLGISRQALYHRIKKIGRAEAEKHMKGELPNRPRVYGRRPSEATKELKKLIADIWFDGTVYVIQRGFHFPESATCERFREVIQQAAIERGGKCTFRILKDSMMFVYEARTP